MSNPPHNKALLDALALHYDDLVSYIRLRFRDRHFARDLVHDVYLQILDKPPRERVSLPLAFLRKVTFNRAIDRVRAESLRAAHLAAASSDEPALDSWDGAQALDFEQQLLALLAIIEALPARQRQVFLLHRIHGMAQREIASEPDRAGERPGAIQRGARCQAIHRPQPRCSGAGYWHGIRCAQ